MGSASQERRSKGGQSRGRAGEGWQIRVRGLVQGVGFRPAVWRLARGRGLAGEVLNDAEGVLIRLAAPRAVAEELAAALAGACPPLARIDAIEISPCPRPPAGEFSIAASAGGAPRAAVTPDAATCPACRAEIFDPGNRRFGYAFANCTNCGPRLSITRAIPYDRASTSMAAFAMCPACRAEYEDPADRRFHAQPNACPACGPRLWLKDARGRPLPGEALEQAAELLGAGRIVAIKGIGGWQLAADAHSAEAVEELRRRKRRPHKPLALMAPDIAAIRRLCHVDEAEARELHGPAAPIVLLRRRAAAGEALPETVAPGMNRLGFMLPATPLHHLLMARLGRVVVLTSGNASGDPQITGDDEALERLGPVADAFLGHDRAVVQRVDDSVVQLGADTGRQVLRHARGLAPAPLRLHEGFAGLPPVLAMGGDIKNAFCLLGDGQAILSPHVGDMATARARRDLGARIGFLRGLLGRAPARIAVDLHPGYYASRLGREIAAAEGLEIVEVQHHHAHVAAVMAGAGLAPDAPPVLGIVLDGLGWGADGSIWGGEFLRADFSGFERLARFAPVPMPGGDAASRAPWRNLLAHLHAAFGEAGVEGLIRDYPGLAGIGDLAQRPWKTLLRMIARGVNAPPASSAGRLFDAVAAALGLCVGEQSFEGQAAMLLQAAAERAPDAPAPEPWPVACTGGVIGWKPLWLGLIEGLARGTPTADLAARFHATLSAALIATALPLMREGGLAQVALCGGGFQNLLLLEDVARAFRARGVEVLRQETVPLNDGGLAPGQGAIAAVRGGQGACPG